MGKRRTLQALLASILAVLCAVSVNFAVKFAAQQETAQHIILFFRFVGGMFFTLPLIMYYGGRSYKSNAPLLQFLRALMVILSMALFFWTIALMPVGIAGAVRGIGPLFIPIGAIFFLREKATFKLFFPVCIAMAGAMIATETAIPNKATFALTIGIISAALSGLAAPLGKHLQKHDDLLVLVTWPAFGGIILTTGWVAIAGFTMPDIWVALSLSIAGVFGYLGWFLLQWAYQTEVVLFVWTEKRQS